MPRIARALALGAALALMLVACASSKDTGLSTGPTEEQSQSNKVEVIDSLFKPATLTVKAGTEVDWAQTGSLPHSVTADDASFDSSPGCLQDPVNKCLKSGAEFKRTFDKAGTYKYYCVIHGSKGGVGMSGSIVVQ